MSKYKLISIIIILIITLITLSIHPTNQIVLYNYHPTFEISNKFNPKANIKKVIGGSIDPSCFPEIIFQGQLLFYVN